ncbi:MAG: type II secretion system protein GspG, partial [bacterium]
MNRDRERRERAFTLVELLLVVTIIGILAGAVLINISGQSKRARIQRAKSDITSIETGLSLYEMAIGEYPEDLQDLIEDPGIEGWSGPYFKKKSILDPWGNEYQYSYPGQYGVEYD